MDNGAVTDAEHGQIVADAAQVYEDFFVPALFGQFTGAVLDAADVQTGHRVLDVGCGTGAAARAASDAVGPEGVVVGVDPNAGMLAVAAAAAPAVDWRSGTAEDLPFEDGTFDRVVSQFAAMFFEDRDRAIEEIGRVLAPGGRAAIATWVRVDESPGYAAMVDLLRRMFGEDAANALLAPFCIGRPDDLRPVLERGLHDVAITRREGTARFDSIEAWVHTDIRGWTLSDMIDDDGHAALLAAARSELARFTDADGRVRFAAPALIGSGTSTGGRSR